MAYLCLPRKTNEKSDHCRRVEPGMVLDINKEGSLIGIELLALELITLAAINAVLEECGFEPIEEKVINRCSLPSLGFGF